jgi:DnaA-homolog protein
VKQLVLELIPTPAPSFDNLVIGQNKEAVNALSGAALQALPAKVVYLWGVSGSGKTHCLQAVSIQLQQSILVANKFQPISTPILLIDDVQQFADIEQIALFNAINERAIIANSGVIVSGNTAPRDLPLRPELTSRLGSGLVFQLHALTDEEKVDALKTHALARGFALRDEVTNYLIRHSRRDMASLIAMLDALDHYSLETGREITLPLLKQMSQPPLT